MMIPLKLLSVTLGKLKIIFNRITRPIVCAGESSVPEKERIALRNFNIISAVTGLMVIIFGGIIYSVVPSTQFLIGLILESSAFAGLIYLNSVGKFEYSKAGMYLTHCCSAIYFGAWLGEALPVHMVTAFLFVYLIGSSCQVYKSWKSRAGFIAATLALSAVVFINRSFEFIKPQHFPREYLTLITILCCGGMLVLMGFVAVTMISQNDRLAKQAEEANLQKTKYVHETSHELRTPLNTILGNAQLLLDYEEPLLALRNGTDIVDLIHNLHDGTQAMREIINNQLDMAKIEAGKFDEISITSFSLHDLLSRNIRQHRSVARDKGVAILTQYDDGINLIKSDQLFLLKITNNLLSNAIKFTDPASEVTVATRLDGDCIELSFTNLGRLPEEKLATLFSPFHSERNLQVAGTGLGLAITKKLVEYLQGTITVETGPEHTRFVVRFSHLPAHLPEVGKSVAKRTPSGVGENEPSKRATVFADAAKSKSLSGICILIVEDDKMNQVVLDKMLTNVGARVVCVYTAEEAILQLPVVKPDVIISDWSMPGMGGIGLLEFLLHRRMQIPVIVASGSTAEASLQGFEKAGAAAHILKPLDREALMATLTSVLEKYAKIL